MARYQNFYAYAKILYPAPAKLRLINSPTLAWIEPKGSNLILYVFYFNDS